MKDLELLKKEMLKLSANILWKTCYRGSKGSPNNKQMKGKTVFAGYNQQLP